MRSRNKLLNIQDASDYLGINPGTLRHWAQSQKIKALKVGSRGDWRFTQEELLKMIKVDDRERKANAPEINAEIKKQFKTLEAVVAAVQDYVYVFDREGRFIFANKKLLNLWGISKKDAIGKTMQDLNYPKTVEQALLDGIKQVIKTKKAYQNITHYTDPSGKSADYENLLSPIFDSQGEVLWVAGSSRDITKRKKSEESNYLLASIVSSSDDAIVSKNLDGIITSWNKGAEDIFGYTADEAIGKHITLIIPKELHQEEKEIIKNIKKGIHMKHYETIRQRKDGSRVALSLTISPVKDKNGKIIGASKIARDITVQKELQRAVLTERHRLENILESISDAFIAYDKNWNFTYVNEKAAYYAGMKPEDMIGKSAHELFPERVKSQQFKEYQHVMQTGKPKKLEYYTPISKRWMQTRLYPSPEGLSAFATDVTDKKKAEERQKFLEEASIVLSASIDYETTLKNLGKLIIPYLADYCRIVVLDEDQQIKEITANHMDSKKLSLVRELYDAYKDGSSAGVRRIIETGKSELMSTLTPEILKGANPKVLKIIKELNLQSYMGVPMKMGNKILGALTFSSSTDGRVYTKEDLILAEELARRAALAIENATLYTQVKEAVDVRDEFISVASHELKTPVTSLKIYTQTMMRQLERLGDDISTRPLFKMNQQINKLTDLISDLLDVSKVGAGKLEFHESSFDLQQTIMDVIENIQPVEQEHIIELVGNIKKKVWGDRDRIEQVITNLITNAVKFSPKANKVVIHLSSTKDEAKVTVEDFGVGIDKKNMNKIFDKFYRVNNPDEKTFPGLGLGLYISYQIIQRHGGKMQVESEKGKGSKFSFTIPYVKN